MSQKVGDASTGQIQRLVNWNTEVLVRLLKQVAAKRLGSGQEVVSWTDDNEPSLPPRDDGATALDEVNDHIDLPGFTVQRRPVDPAKVELPPEVVDQLKKYILAVSEAYYDNPFHCLQHASQVTTALTKLLSRIVVKQLEGEEEEEYVGAVMEDLEDEDDDDEEEQDEEEMTAKVAPHLHNHTYGITSDPLAQFAVVLAALVHEVDNAGITNDDIIRTDPETAAKYKNRSIIEQRSLDKAWNKLMEPSFVELRKFLYTDEAELKRFRQVMVNSILSTDIFDPELQELRRNRWEKTLSHLHDSSPQDVNRKATIVLEHLMQASDNFHTMSPWIVYEKWSQRKFEETYIAFQQGKTTEDPTETWHQKELECFDNYYIPLAMQLKDCDAFVVASDEFLDLTLKNRQTLATKSKEMVPAFLEVMKKKSPSANGDTMGSPITPARTVSPLEEQRRAVSKQVHRLVEWNTEILQRMLKSVVAKRAAGGVEAEHGLPPFRPASGENSFLDEMSEVLEFPEFDVSSSPDKWDIDAVELDVAVVAQLHDLVAMLASNFKGNDFHGFDRGSAVGMTARKQLLRMTTQSRDDQARPEGLYDRTLGISQDPLAQFAIIFSALFHGCGHPGVPNSQLIRENSDLAMKYKNRCMIEQNSLDIVWDCLMSPKLDDLRACIFGNVEEMKRFRQLLINCFLATNTVDDELAVMKKERWDKAFVDGKKDNSVQNRNRRATIVLEMLMQSSDIFYATQNWHLYQKWNDRHFAEAYKSYQAGRVRQDPCIFWYKSELLFFDEYVIVVAKQMHECGVFGTSGDEQLSFALTNRQQWAAKGGNLVASMMARFHGKEIEKVRAKRVHRRMSLSAKVA
mmetsp:Transcript_23757/g.56090  ORF Transcript_23757/g.56090 Transcript_23757/m.56090 type:complete len:854 (+) Transcript_23757:377-2938(+)